MQEFMPSKTGRMRAVALLATYILPIIFGVVFHSTADELKLTPALGLKEEYNDNILYVVSETQHDFISTISPELIFTDKTEKMDVKLWGKIDRRCYSKHKNLDGTDQYYEGTGKFAITERFDLSGRVYYSNDSRPDRDLESTGLTMDNVRRFRQTYNFSGDYSLSEIMLATFNYEYQNDEYDNSAYLDMEAHAFNFGVTQDMSYFANSTQARVNVGYTKYNIQNLKLDSYDATIGVNRSINETWNFLLDAGVRYTKSEHSFLEESSSGSPMFVQRKGSNRGWGGVGQLVLTYKGHWEDAKLSIAHDIMPASGRSGASNRTSFVLNLWKRWTNEFYTTFYFWYYINRSQPREYSLQKIDENTIGIMPGIQYRFNEDAALEVFYGYNRTKFNENGDVANRNLFQVRFRIQHNLFE